MLWQNLMSGIVTTLLILGEVEGVMKRGENSRCSHINRHTLSEYDCAEIPFCKKTYNISYIDMLPYAPSKGIQEFLQLCCGNCTRWRVTDIFRNLSEVSPNSINKSHFAYPFLGSVTDSLVNGYFFIPIMHAPKAYYLTMRTEVTLFHSLFHMFPLVTVCLLMAAVAGFVCWIAETRSNTEEFPKSFLDGWFQGFWWSVASMTTVGYGDKTPKTVFGRLFGIVWIFTGITICGILTAMLTTTTMDANNPKVPSMAGAKVGVLKHRHYDALLVSHHGGLLVEAKSLDFESAIYELVKSLPVNMHDDDSGLVDGILLDSYTLWYVLGDTSFGKKKTSITNSQRKEIIRQMKEMVLSKVEYDLEVLAYGILVKHEDDFEFLNDVIRSNRFLMRTDLDLQWNRVQADFFHRYSPGIFDAKRSYFQVSVFCLSGGIVLICCFGFFYELRRRKCANRNYLGTVNGLRM